MNNEYLSHHGIKGQKWGVRRYQNPDGTLTDAGRKRAARQYTKDLKKAEYKYTDSKIENYRAKKDLSDIHAKNKARGYENLSDRSLKKELKAESRESKTRIDMENARNTINYLSYEAASNGFTVDSIPTQRMAKRYAQIGYVFGNIRMAAVYAADRKKYGDAGVMSDATKYKVTANKNGERNQADVDRYFKEWQKYDK